MKNFYHSMAPDSGGNFLHETEKGAIDDAILKVEEDGRRRFIVQIIGEVKIAQPVTVVRYRKNK